MTDIDNLFPIDPEVTDEDIEAILARTDNIRRNVALGAGTVATAIAAYKIFRHFKPYTGIDIDQD